MTGNSLSRYVLGIAFGLALAAAANAAPGPDLAVTKTCTLGANQSVTCTVTIKNIGNIPSVAPLHVTDTVNPVAAGTLYTGAGGSLPFSCGPAGLYTSVGPVQCNANNSLAPGQSGTLLVAFKLPQGGVLYNCATATAAQNAATLPDPNPANNTGCTKIQVPPPPTGKVDIQTTKICTVGANQSVTCTITIKNIGTAPSPAPLHVTDTVSSPPAGTLFTGAGGSLPFGCGPAGLYTSVGPVQCNANVSLAPGQSGTLLLSFQLPNGGVLANCATSSAAQIPGTPGDANPNNNTSCTKVQVAGGGGKPDIKVTKSCQPDPAHAHTVICSVTVANVGNAVSIAPFTLTEWSSSGYPTGTVFNGVMPGSTTINCSQGANTPFTGPITCTGNYALNFGNTSGASASEFFSFTGPAGKKFMNCAKAVQGPGMPAETVLSNNQSCVSVMFP